MRNKKVPNDDPMSFLLARRVSEGWHLADTSSLCIWKK
jgi:hypothetical protein